jgi:hypothetical protein
VGADFTAVYLLLVEVCVQRFNALRLVHPDFCEKPQQLAFVFKYFLPVSRTLVLAFTASCIVAADVVSVWNLLAASVPNPVAKHIR